MDSSLWGMCAWHLLHLITFTAPNKLNNNYYNIFKSLKYILPCRVCRTHYNSNLKKLSYTNSNTRDELVLWLINFHNIVNKMLGKRIINANKCTNIYLNKDNKLKIDHTKAFKFLDVLHKCYKLNTNKRRDCGYKLFFTSLKRTFPCTTCKTKYNELLQKYPYESNNFYKWYFKIRKEWYPLHINLNCKQYIIIKMINIKASIAENVNSSFNYIYKPNLKNIINVKHNNKNIIINSLNCKPKNIKIGKTNWNILSAKLITPIDVKIMKRKGNKIIYL